VIWLVLVGFGWFCLVWIKLNTVLIILDRFDWFGWFLGKFGTVWKGFDRF
jgi:hypothetical protein